MAHQIRMGVSQTLPQLKRQYDRITTRYTECGKHVPEYMKQEPSFRVSAAAKELLRGAMQVYGERLAEIANEARQLTAMEGVHEKHVDFAVSMAGTTYFGFREKNVDAAVPAAGYTYFGY
jgi:hypothetical protein